MNDKDIKLIEDYIDGGLQGEELLSFEKRLKTDKSLSKEYKQRIKYAELWIDAADYSKTKAGITEIFHKNEVSFFQANRYLIFSIAASLIILVGVYFLLVQDNNGNINGVGNQFADVQDSIREKEKTIVFQYDEPVKLAVMDSVGSKIQLLFPINGEAFSESEPITFKWKSDLNLNDTLFICKESDRKILLRLRINLADTNYTIKYPQFTQGKYLWYISDIAYYEKFSVINR